MKLSEMKQVLAVRGIQLTKSLGQNFLHDGNQLRKIVDAGRLRSQDRVLEVGPGLGPLTELLLAQAGSVLAVEKDERLVEVLRERFPNHPRLTLVAGDALEYTRRHREWAGWKAISNLPYSVASPILVELALAASGPDRIVATLQLEVAERAAARAGDDAYGVFSLLLQLHYTPAPGFKIPASCFHPMPEVDSGCLVLERRPRPLLAPDQTQTFVQLVKRAFSQRRKMMLKLLRQDWPAARLEAGFASLGLAPQTRAEEVSLEQFVRLAGALTASSSAA
ncbi:MAG TPA: 16S rRNA (adenine(1518)-N(6)/adenine(1519)-N(6))-dimethyltransferase RsmA [Candidatus Saccharimonadales bacterium]|nr:16S rRNA (adenine(1518)-N(6)/adenine(1519)-N(6))-dimethyltransferase RsmA [Candidatus Saccharimonadales bacterium]